MIISSTRAHALAACFLLASMVIVARAHPRHDPRSIQVEPRGALSRRRGVARESGPASSRTCQGRAFKGTLGQSPRAAEGARPQRRAGQGAEPPGDLRQPEADEDTRVVEYQAMREEVIQLGSKEGAAWAFFEPEILTLGRGEAWLSGRVDAGPEAVRVLPGRHPAAEGAHAQRRRGSDASRRSARWPPPSERLEHPAQRRPAVADRHAGRRQELRLDISGFSAARASATATIARR